MRSPGTPLSRRPRSSPGPWPRPGSAPTSKTAWTTWPTGWTPPTCAGPGWPSASNVRSAATSLRPSATPRPPCPPGNALTAEKLLGYKGAGLLAGGLLGILYGGLSFRGVMFGAVGAAAGFLVPDVLVSVSYTHL